MVGNYTYDAAYQLRIISLLVQDRSFVPSRHLVLDPAYFSNPWHREIADAILCLARANGFRVPDKIELMAELQDRCRRGRMGPEALAELGVVVDVIYFPQPLDPTLRERVIDFGARQGLKRAILDVSGGVESDRPVEEMYRVLSGAIAARADQSVGLDAVEGARSLQRCLAESSYNAARRHSTGFPTIDRVSWGGLGVGEITVVCGDPSVGKSTVLCNIGTSCVLTAATVAHVSLELGEIDLLLKYLARITTWTIPEIVQMAAQGRDIMELLRNTPIAPGRLTIKRFAPGTLDVGGLEAYLVQLEAVVGVRPSVVILDYADRMRTGGDDRYSALGTLYDQLITLSQERQFALLTASQLRRQEYATGSANASSIAESWQKMFNADNVYVLNQTPEDKAAGMLDILLAKVRRGESGIRIKCRVDYARARVKEDIYVPSPTGNIGTTPRMAGPPPIS